MLPHCLGKKNTFESVSVPFASCVFQRWGSSFTRVKFTRPWKFSNFVSRFTLAMLHTHSGNQQKSEKKIHSWKPNLSKTIFRKGIYSPSMAFLVLTKNTGILKIVQFFGCRINFRPRHPNLWIPPHQLFHLDQNAGIDNLPETNSIFTTWK